MDFDGSHGWVGAVCLAAGAAITKVVKDWLTHVRGVAQQRSAESSAAFDRAVVVADRLAGEVAAQRVEIVAQRAEIVAQRTEIISLRDVVAACHDSHAKVSADLAKVSAQVSADLATVLTRIDAIEGRK